MRGNSNNNNKDMAQARQSSSPRTQHSTKAVQSHVANTSSCSSNSMRQAMFKQQAPQQLSKNHYNGNNNSTSSPQSPACTSPLDSRFLYSPTTATTITVKRAFTMVQPDESGKPPTAIASSMNTATGKSSTTSSGHNIGEPANCACCTSSSSSNHNHNTLTVNSSITRTTHQEEDVFSSYLNNQKDTTSFIYFEGEEEEESEGTSSYNEDDSEYTEDEDEEDQEEDENAHQLPFWFGVEEACHISEVIKRYSTFLKLNEKRGANSRLPVRFVGKVQRSVMSLIFNEDREVESMKTFDEVHIYEKSSSLMYGAVHPKVSEILLETEYDWQGIPTKFVKKKTSEKPDDLDERYCSWLFCYPIYASDKFGYESVLGDEDIDHRKDIGYCDLYNKCLQRLSISKAKECIGSPEQSQFCYSPSINDDTNSDEEENENSDNDDLDHLPSYMKDLIPHLSGSGPLEVDRCFGYFDDDK